MKHQFHASYVYAMDILSITFRFHIIHPQVPQLSSSFPQDFPTNINYTF